MRLNMQSPTSLGSMAGQPARDQAAGGAASQDAQVQGFEVEALEEADPRQLRALRRMRVWEAVVNNVAFMATPFLMPSTFASTGWTMGVGFCVYSAVLTYTTGVILGDICTLHPELHSYPLIAREAFRRICRDRLGGGEVSQRRWGKCGHWLCQVVQFACYYLTGIAELIYFEQYLSQLAQETPLCQSGWLVVAAAVISPVLQVPTFRESRWVALVALALAAFNATVFFYQVALVRPWSCNPGPVWSRPQWSTVIVGLSSIAYAFGGHGLYPEELREMKDPSKWRLVMRWTYAVVVPLYMAMAVVGYYAYGANAKANLNRNFPDNLANRMSLIVQAIQEMYYVFFALLVLVLQVELSLEVDATACCRGAGGARAGGGSEESSGDAQDSRADGYSEGGSCSSSETEDERGAVVLVGRRRMAWKEWLSLRKCGVPPIGFRLIFRTLFLGTNLAIAEMLIGGDGDVLLSTQALAGAVGFTMLTYFMPLLFAWAFFPALGAARLLYYGLNFALCLVLMCVGIFFSAQELMGSAGVFAGAQCKLSVAGYVDANETADLTLQCLRAVGRGD